MAVSIFEFDDPVDYICRIIDDKRKKNPSYSLRSWARKLGYKSPSYVSHVTRRERAVSPELVQRIKTIEELDTVAGAYLDALVIGQGKSDNFRSAIMKSLNRGTSRAERTNVKEDEFALIADWFHIVIFEMTKLKEFDGTIRFFSKKLKGKVTAERIRKAVGRLEKLGFLVRDDKNAICRKENQIIAVHDPPSAAIRAYHRQMLEMATAAIEEQTILERHLQGTTVAIKKEDFNKVCTLVAEFHRNLQAFDASGTADSVYQMNTQFFQHI